MGERAVAIVEISYRDGAFYMKGILGGTAFE